MPTEPDTAGGPVQRGLQTQTPAQQQAGRIVPWFISLGLHGLLVMVAFVVTWSVINTDREEPITVVADFDQMYLEPVTEYVATVPEQAESTESPTDISEMIDRTLDELALDQVDMIAPAASRPPDLGTAAPARSSTASFAGLKATNARRIVYVVDASGSMIGAFRTIVDEMGRSLDRMVPRQSFGIIFFQQNKALTVPPRGRLQPATEANRDRALAWIDREVVPRGRSNPLEAIEAAIRLEPDVIFLLSNDITGSDEYEIDQEELLRMLETMNPLEPGRTARRCQIQCIQFLDPDPLETLKRIAEIHGGPDGFKYIDREQLGLRPTGRQ